MLRERLSDLPVLLVVVVTPSTAMLVEVSLEVGSGEVPLAEELEVLLLPEVELEESDETLLVVLEEGVEALNELVLDDEVNGIPLEDELDVLGLELELEELVDRLLVELDGVEVLIELLLEVELLELEVVNPLLDEVRLEEELLELEDVRVVVVVGKIDTVAAFLGDSLIAPVLPEPPGTIVLGPSSPFR